MNKTLQEKDNECLTLRKYIEELQISLRSIQMGKDIQSGIVHTHGYSPSFEGKLIDRNIENENRLVEENRLLKL